MLKKMELAETETVVGGEGDTWKFIRDAALSPWNVVVDGAHDMFTNPTSKEDCSSMWSEHNQALCENTFNREERQADNAKQIWRNGEHDLNYSTGGRLIP